MSPLSPRTRARLTAAESRKNTIISAISNLSTAFNLANISVAHVMIENQYCGGDKCGAEVDAASTAVLVGAIMGQLTFGYIGDCLGRPRALQLTMAMSILGALISAFAVPITDDKSSIFTFLIITRGILGVGVGGVYPLSATIASESATDEKSRGTSTALVFSMQGVANLLVPLLGMLLVAICGNPGVMGIDSAKGEVPDNNGWAWRLLLGLGALPGILLIPAGKVKSISDEEKQKLSLDPESLLDGGKKNKPPGLLEALREPGMWRKVLGTAGGWFLFDITFYGNNLFQSTVLRSVFKVHGKSTAISGGLDHNVIAQMAVVSAMGLPGYYVAVYFMDRLGRKNIQLQGFFFMAITFAILGIFESDLQSVPVLMLILYGLTFFFSNFGPNTTTFILPAETFTPEVRSTMNGFSAACGKVGATLGSAVFKPVDAATSLGFTMCACAVVALLGFAITWYGVEDRLGLPAAGDPGSPEFDTQEARSMSGADGKGDFEHIREEKQSSQ